MKPWIRNVLILVAAGLVLVAIFGYWQSKKLAKAHSTFENYYAFRGCKQLLERTDTYGTCITDSGKTIKIVQYEGRWFLDGDLPCKSGLCW